MTDPNIDLRTIDPKTIDPKTTVPAAAPALAPIAHPLGRNAEARAIATAAGWPLACPDAACARTGRCAGQLRSVLGGPASFPTCLQIACRLFHDRDNLTLREANAMLHFLRPGEGWTMQPTPADGEAGWPLPGDEGDESPASEPDFLITMMGLLGDSEVRGGGGTERERERS